MPTISVFYGIVIQMFWRDHAPPHFHALSMKLLSIYGIFTSFAALCHAGQWR
jgi:hypothetical protein